MPHSRFPYLDPASLRSIPVIPQGSTVLNDAAASSSWAGVLSLEEHSFPPLEVAEFTTAGPMLHLPLCPLTPLEYRADRSWARVSLQPSHLFLTPAGMPQAYRWRKDFRALDVMVDPAFLARALPEEAGAELPFVFGV